MTAIRAFRARPDPSLEAVVLSRTALRYDEGADPSRDRPAHVRAGSSLARVGGWVALVQDDANFVALVDAASHRVRAVELPAGEGGLRQFDDARGNKAAKLDLEACVAARDGERTLLVAFGSGSTRRREHVATIAGLEGDAPDVSLVRASPLYERLRAERAFAGEELNVEGAVLVGERLRLFARGNGAPREGRRPPNATCELAWDQVLAHLREPSASRAPDPARVASWDLGALDGIPLGFTDASEHSGRLLYSAAAEDSPDAVQDGRVAGSAIGIMDDAGEARWAPLLGPDGEPFAGKVEGLVGDGDDERRLLVVLDGDDPHAPSELCVVELRGPWW